MRIRHFSAPDLQAVHQLLQASGCWGYSGFCQAGPRWPLCRRSADPSAQRANLQVKIARSFRLIKHFINPDMAGSACSPPAEGIALPVAQARGADAGAPR